MVASAPPITLYRFRLSDGVEAGAAARDTVLACFGDEGAVLSYFGRSLTYGNLTDTRRYLGVSRTRHVSAFHRLLTEAFGAPDLRNAPPPARLTAVAGSAAWPPATERRALEAAMRQGRGGLDIAAVAAADAAMSAMAIPAAPHFDIAQLATEFGSSDPFVRRLAIDRLTTAPRTAEGDAMMLLALRDSSEYVKRAAAYAVGKWRWAEAGELVISLLDDRVALTRQTALGALVDLPDAAGHDRICHLFTGDRDAGVRNAAANVLVAMASPDNWRRSFDLLATDAIPRHRQWACGLTGRFGGVADIDGLDILLHDGDGHVRKSAARARDAIAVKATL